MAAPTIATVVQLTYSFYTWFFILVFVLVLLIVGNVPNIKKLYRVIQRQMEYKKHTENDVLLTESVVGLPLFNGQY